MATIRLMFAASPGSWGWPRIASRMAFARGLDLRVAVIQLLSPAEVYLARREPFAAKLTVAWALGQPGPPTTARFRAVSQPDPGSGISSVSPGTCPMR